MKTPILQVAVFLLSLITAGEPFQKECQVWYPAPVTVQQTTGRRGSPALHSHFRVVEDFVEDRDADEWHDVVRDYVADAFADRVLTNWQILTTILKHFPSIRTLFFALVCVVIAKFLFYLTWQLCLIDVFRRLGVRLRFTHHRYGLTFFPIVCILTLLILNSNYSTISNMAHDGLKTLRAGDDNGQALLTRTDRSMFGLLCRFSNAYEEYMLNIKGEQAVDKYLRTTVGGAHHTVPTINLWPSVCPLLQKDVFAEIEKLNGTLYPGFANVTQLVFQHQINYYLTAFQSLRTSLTIVTKALVRVQDFVTAYHADALQLPTPGSMTALHVVIFGMSIGAIGITCTFMALSVTMVQVRRRWLVALVYCAIVALFVFAAILVALFLAIFVKVSFILLTQNECVEKRFTIFNSTRPWVHSEGGYTYTINFGDFLAKSFNSKATWFSLLKNHNQYEGGHTDLPIALDGHRLWNQSKAFNETFDRFVDIAANYAQYSAKACETMGALNERIDEAVASSNCTTKSVLENTLKIFRNQRDTICQQHANLTANHQPPPSIETLRELSLAFWKNILIRELSYGVLARTEVIDNFGTMQMYLVFINPAVKLQSTVLEPWFGLAVLALAMAPVMLIMAVYLMCIAPMVIVETTTTTMGSSSEGSDGGGEGGGGGAKTNTKSKSRSRSNSQSKSQSNESNWGREG